MTGTTIISCSALLHRNATLSTWDLITTLESRSPDLLIANLCIISMS